MLALVLVSSMHIKRMRRREGKEEGGRKRWEPESRCLWEGRSQAYGTQRGISMGCQVNVPWRDREVERWLSTTGPTNLPKLGSSSQKNL